MPTLLVTFDFRQCHLCVAPPRLLAPNLWNREKNHWTLKQPQNEHSIFSFTELKKILSRPPTDRRRPHVGTSDHQGQGLATIGSCACIAWHWAARAPCSHWSGDRIWAVKNCAGVPPQYSGNTCSQVSQVVSMCLLFAIIYFPGKPRSKQLQATPNWNCFCRINQHFKAHLGGRRRWSVRSSLFRKGAIIGCRPLLGLSTMVIIVSNIKQYLMLAKIAAMVLTRWAQPCCHRSVAKMGDQHHWTHHLCHTSQQLNHSTMLQSVGGNNGGKMGNNFSTAKLLQRVCHKGDDCCKLTPWSRNSFTRLANAILQATARPFHFFPGAKWLWIRCVGFQVFVPHRFGTQCAIRISGAAPGRNHCTLCGCLSLSRC